MRLEHDDEQFLEKLMGGPLTLGGALSALRESDDERLTLQGQVREAGLKLRIDVYAT